MTTGHFRILTLSIACVVCACFVDSASAQPQPAPAYFFCLSEANRDTLYFSGVFVIDYSIDGAARAWDADTRERKKRGGHGNEDPGPTPWLLQFNQVVAQTYPRTLTRGSHCEGGFITLAEAQKKLDSMVIQYENNFKVYKSGWKYKPNPNAKPPAPASQPAAAAAPTQRQGAPPVLIWDVCWVRGVDIQADPLQMAQAVFYVSGALPLYSMADYHDVPSAFARFIANKFKLPTGMASSADCTQVQTLTEAQSWIDAESKIKGATKRAAAALGAGPYCWRGHCIMTDWTNTAAASAPEPPVYTPAAAAPAPAPAALRPGDPCYFSGVGLATAPPAGCRAPVTSYAVCYSANNQSTVYLSSAFAVTDGASQSWINGFTQFLAQKYSYQGGGVGCNNMTMNIAQTSLKNRIAALRVNKKQVVETGWAYGSSAALAAAPVAPIPSVIPEDSAATHNATGAPSGGAAARGPMAYAVCWTESKEPTAYFSAPFDAGKHDYAAWNRTFANVLMKQYGFAGAVRCVVLAKLDDAQRYLQGHMNRLRPTKKIVDTGWKYE